MSALPNINIRSNFFLWLLTGRSTGFANSALNTSINYVVNSTPAEVTYARRFLKLDTLGDDFNALSVYAASLMSKAMLREMPRDVAAVFVPGLLALRKIVTSAPMLGRSDHADGYVDGSVAGARGFNSLSITRTSDTAVDIRTSNGIRATSSATLTSLDGGDFRLSVAAAPLYGIFADFQVTQWTSDDSVSVSLAPTRYPFVDTAERLRKDRAMVLLMNSEGTLAAFESSPANPAMRVGMAGLAIIRRMLKWTTEEQAGYSVSAHDSVDAREPLDTFYTIAPGLVGMTEAPVDPDSPIGFHV
jgi:hypothetical protein